MKHQNKTLGAGKQPRAAHKTVWRHCIACTAKELLPWWLAGAAVAMTLAHCSNNAHAGQSAKAQSMGCARATVAPALKGAGAENTISVAEAAPAWEKRGFVTSGHGAGAAASGLRGFGRDGAIRKDARTATDVFSHPARLLLLKTATGGFFNVPVGA